MTAPTAKVYSRRGALLESPVATPDSVSTTVVSAASAVELVLASGTGVARGRFYRITDPTWGDADSGAAAVDGAAVRLLDPLPAVPDAGSAFVGLEVSVTLTALSTPAVGEAYMVVVHDEDTDQEVTDVYDVAVHPFLGPVTADQVRGYYAECRSADQARLQDEAYFVRIADRANLQLRTRLQAADRYLHRYWSRDAFVEPGRLLYQLILAERNIVPAGRVIEDFVTGLRFELRDRIEDIIRSTQPYDTDGDGTIDDDEKKGGFSARVSRSR